MKWAAPLFVLISVCACWARTGSDSRQEAEYYVAAYARTPSRLGHEVVAVSRNV